MTLLNGWIAAAQRHWQSLNKVLCLANSREINSNGTIWPWQIYKSSNATPPSLAINRIRDCELADGLLLLDPVPIAPEIGGKFFGPLIMDNTGELVWHGPFLPAVSNFRVQTLHGEPVLSYWSGEGTAGADNIVGHGWGEVKILDTNYNVVDIICPNNIEFQLPPGVQSKCFADLHESYITPNNALLVTMYNTTTADLTSVGGPKNGYVLKSLAAEVDIATSEVI